MGKAILFVILLLVYCTVGWLLQPLHFVVCLVLTLTTNWEYPRNVFLNYDQSVNTYLVHILDYLFKPPGAEFGDPDETISSVIGKNLRDHPSRSPRAFYVIDHWLTKIDPNAVVSHCREVIEQDTK